MKTNNKPTYISLFSSAGIGCYGFKLEGFDCIATNELIARRLEIQKFNNKCKYKFVINIKDLIKSGDLKKETKDEETIEENSCSIYNPKDKTMCMDCLDINITLDATYKTVTASLDLNSANVCHEEYTTN